MDLSDQFLNVKTIPPQIRAERVKRQRLMKKLEGIFKTPVTVICAPAGYGKTTLLVDWMETAPAPVVWFTLSDEENDAVRFLNYLVQAIQSALPEIGKSTQAAINLPGTTSLENCLHLLVNELSTLTSPIAIVLDDYHEITSSDVQEMVSHLVEHLPPKLHLIFATRIEPPLPLARLRARNLILEVRTRDLSFKVEEIKEFFRLAMNSTPSETVCRQLERQTEGWISALQLAAISMREGEDILTGAGPFAGRHYIFDFLAEEVLSKLPDDMRKFLLCVSLPERLSGPLCDVLVKPFQPHENGAQCLEALEHASLFIQALDEDHKWYRFHTLFAEFLRNRLAEVAPEEIPLLHQRSASWLTANGLVEEAYVHALLGGNQEQAVQIIENQASVLEVRGEMGTLEQWLKRLPEERILSRPRLCLASAWIAFCRLDTQNVQKYLNKAEALLTDSHDEDLLGELLAARAFLAGMTDNAEQTTLLNEKAASYLRDQRHFLYCLLKLNQSLPVMMSGNLQKAVPLLEEAINYARATENHFIALLGMRILGEAYMLQGRYSWAENLFQQAMEMIQAHLGTRSPLIGVARLGLGEIYRQRNRLAEAEKELEEGIAQVIDWLPAIVLDGLAWLSNTRQSGGDPAGARRALQKAKEISLDESHPLLDEWMLEIIIARLNIIQGNLEEGLRWAKSKGLNLDTLDNLDDFYQTNPSIFRTSALTTLARLYLLSGRREKTPGALEKSAYILTTCLPIARNNGENAILMEGLLILAQAAACLGDETRAQECVHNALDLGETERPIRIFLDEGKHIIALLEKRRSMDLPSNEYSYIDLLLSTWQTEKAKLLRARSQSDALTFRELDVLRLVAEGKSNQQISEQLVLSLNTVKKHVSSAMDKLDARNRSTAVIIARQQGLIN